jgi:hypothetical protein
MFQDPLVAVMTMLLLCFTGILAIFLFSIRSFSSHTEELHEALRKQQLSLADIERQLMDLSFALRKSPAGGADAASADPAGAARGGADGLTSMRQEDLMSLLESASQQKKSASPRFDDQLLPPPAGARPAAHDYDPANDPHLFEDSLLPDPSYAPYRTRADRLKAGSSAKQGASLSLKLDD